MKAIHCVPPLVALIIAASWLTSLRRSTDAVSKENAVMRERLASPGKSSFSRENRNDARSKSDRTRVAPNARPKRERKTPDNVDSPSGDWVGISRDWSRLVLSNNDEPATRYRYTAAWKRLVTLASEMNGDELTRAYTEMAGLPVHAPFRNELESLMLDELENKNPEFAFSQYLARNQNSGAGGLGRFDEWLARDPAAATNWYEKQLASDVFDKTLDGKSPAKVPFESAYIMSLINSDPAAAEQIMNNLPPDLRGRFGDYVDVVPKEKRQSLVDLLRKTMPTEEYVALLRETSVFEYNFRGEYDSDPDSAKRILDSFAVSPAERTALLADQFSEFAEYRAMRVSGGGDPRRNEFDENRKWVQAVDPSSADRATGVALQTFLKKLNDPESYDFVEKTALDYLDSGAGDELLIPLIEGTANGSNTFPKDRARGLANKITDVTLRNQLLEKLN